MCGSVSDLGWCVPTAQTSFPDGGHAKELVIDFGSYVRTRNEAPDCAIPMEGKGSVVIADPSATDGPNVAGRNDSQRSQVTEGDVTRRIRNYAPGASIPVHAGIANRTVW